jgi:hypothetical protein
MAGPGVRPSTSAAVVFPRFLRSGAGVRATLSRSSASFAVWARAAISVLLPLLCAVGSTEKSRLWKLTPKTFWLSMNCRCDSSDAETLSYPMRNEMTWIKQLETINIKEN